jgi:hypothetical protein
MNIIPLDGKNNCLRQFRIRLKQCWIRKWKKEPEVKNTSSIWLNGRINQWRMLLRWQQQKNFKYDTSVEDLMKNYFLPREFGAGASANNFQY